MNERSCALFITPAEPGSAARRQLSRMFTIASLSSLGGVIRFYAHPTRKDAFSGTMEKFQCYYKPCEQKKKVLRL